MKMLQAGLSQSFPVGEVRAYYPLGLPVDGLRALPEIILGGGGCIFFSDPSTPRTHKESEPPDPQDT